MTTRTRETRTTPTSPGDTLAGAEAPAAISLIPVHLADLPAVVRLERLCFGKEAWNWADFLLALRPGGLFIKAMRNEQMVGFIIADPRGRADITWVLNVAVHPALRNLGIGRQLMEEVERLTATRRLGLTVRVDNEAARHLYRSLGYLEIGLRRGYYPGRVDGIEMEKRRTVPLR